MFKPKINWVVWNTERACEAGRFVTRAAANLFANDREHATRDAHVVRSVNA